MIRSYAVISSYVLFLLTAGHPGVAFPQSPKDSDSLPPIETNGELTGQVVAEDGSPVAARVFLLRSPKEGGHFTLPTKPLETQSDSNGEFTLEQLDEGEYRLWAETDQQTSLEQKLKGRTVAVKKSAMTAPTLTVSLHPGCGYDVTVVDGQGSPLADAKISFGWTDIKRTYSTNENGLASIRNLSVDEVTTIERIVTQSIIDPELIDVGLSRLNPDDYQTVAGRLVDADGEPVVGAAVRLLAGRDVPRANRQGFGKSMGGWNFYHWGLLSADQIEGRDQCEQLLKTVSDAQGHFRFVGVKRDAPWLELFYFGDGIFAQRYSNLRDRDDRELERLELPAARPAQLTVRIDRELHPGGERLSLQAEDYSRGENAILLPFASEDQDIKAVNVFERLPAGSYRLSLQAKPEPTADGAFLVKSLAEKPVVIEAGQTLELEF